MAFFSSLKKALLSPFRRASRVVQEAQAKDAATEFSKRARQVHPSTLIKLAANHAADLRKLSGRERRLFRQNFRAKYRVMTDAVTGNVTLGLRHA